MSHNHKKHGGHENHDHHGHDHHNHHKDHDHHKGHDHHGGHGHHGHHEGHDHHGGHGHHDHHEHHAAMVEDFKFRFWWVLALTIPILALSPMIQEFMGVDWSFTGDIWILFALSSVVFFFGGWPFLYGLVDELRQKQPGMMTLIGLAISVAYIYSTFVVFGLEGNLLFWELSTLVGIMLLGHWIEMRSVMSASAALEKLAELLPGKAHKVQDDGSVVDVPLEELQVGDKVLIKPGEKIPADGVVIEGSTNVNESMLTGESKPVSKDKDDQVIGGAVNEEGSITISINKTGDDSFLSQVIDLVKQAQASKSRTQDLANRAAFWLTLIAITGGILTFFAWIAFTTQDLSFAINRTVTVMVIACPHALGLAIPLVVSVSTTLAATNGFLVRNRVAFEAARNLKAVIFDKTGTLTEGKFGVTDILAFDSISEEELLRTTAAVEVNSEHPIARGIVEKAGDNNVPRVNDFQSITGKGVQGNVEGKNVKVVSPGYLREQKMDYPREQIEELSRQGKTVVFTIIDDKLAGAVALGDQIRDASKNAISKLHDMGIQCVMLTGDNQQTADYVAGQLGIDQVFAEVLPDEKAAKVKEVQDQGMTVAMTGDGVNDAPALAQADVGIAIGAGSDVAVETGDIILVQNNPEDVADVIRLSKATYGKMVQNLFWATGYNVVAIPLAAGVLFTWGVILTPAAGAVLMSLSTVIVAINARFLSMKDD
ncbi:copper-translocating P-type ATPase [Natronogracilivirga saccharolytica]|uniref:Copper-translocating P-type ATPase n=1 Tax=Natronogracilivirga saccharolytica TaxID=2812953 RepID=A0A8J7RJR4_9BACT|nr:copper-translocating P-type ATPase [Natronogracilivirga saccharolytica]MBP3192075.1 copper-translocating P-type ATPase [Natronogracilivirga saccharolytica]